MSYKALYRTYRPMTFSEVAGQNSIVVTLQNAIKNNKIAHAYLFSGPRGTGKTTMAKLFAKALNCEKGEGKQCNECQNCREINEGSHPDVIEIDAASNNGVDDVRELIDKVNYSPLHGKYKVYIIDEVHMMTPSAFNALLKTLEEPPNNVIFILATTEAHKVLPTIVSRCQRFNFSKVSDKDIENRIKGILQAEGIESEDSAIKTIVSLADGGVRDALSMLEQVLAYSNNKLVDKDVLSIFALANKSDKLAFLTYLATGDISSLIPCINNLIENGIDIKRLSIDLLNMLKDGLIYKKTKKADFLLSLNVDEAKELLDIYSTKQINATIDALLKMQSEFRFSNDTTSLFTLTLLSIATSAGDGNDLDVKTSKVQIKQEAKETPLTQTQTTKFDIRPKVVSKTLENNQSETKDTTQQLDFSTLPFMKDINGSKVEEKIVEQEVSVDGEKSVSSVLLDLVENGSLFELSDDALIKASTIANKNDRRELAGKWNELSSYLLDPEYSIVASQLIDGNPFLLTDKLLVLVYANEEMGRRINIKENQVVLNKMLAKFGLEKHVIYALSKVKQIEFTKLFNNYSQLGKLPIVDNIDQYLEGIY